MSIRERIAAYKAAVGPTVSGELRYALTDSEGLALSLEVGPGKCRHAAAVASTAEALKAALEAADKAKDENLDAFVSAANKVAEASRKFWDAFEGEEVDGVTIIRRRA